MAGNIYINPEKLANDAGPPAARDRCWITCQRKKALLFFLEKKVEEQCLERRFSVILYFSLKCIQTELHRP